MIDFERFWGHVAKRADVGCWLWDGKPNSSGYGVYKVDGKMQKAHRIAWQWAYSPSTLRIRWIDVFPQGFTAPNASFGPPETPEQPPETCKQDASRMFPVEA